MATVTSSNPGNLVVPLSAIMQQLQGKLSAADLNALLLAVTGGQKTTVVLPGDLITADLMNQVLSDIADLEVRVATLETTATASQSPIIIDMSPNPVRVGQALTVSGVKFPPDPDLGKVLLDGNAITRFSSASDTQLTFTVPVLSRGLPADVSLTVGSGSLADTKTLQVLPAFIQVTGSVSVSGQTQSLPQILVGSTYQVDYQINSITNIAETYTLQAVYSQTTGTATAADWANNTSVVDPTQSGIPVLTQAYIQPGTPQRARVIFKVPAGAAGATMQLSVNSQSQPNDPNLNQVSNPGLAMTIGQAVTASDPHTTLSLKPYGPLVSNAKITKINNANGVAIVFGQTQFVRVSLSMQLAGTYDYSFKLTPDSTGWVIPSANTILSPASSTKAAGDSDEVGISITSTGNTTPLRTLTITAVRRADNSPSITSWIDIPIEGVTAAVLATL